MPIGESWSASSRASSKGGQRTLPPSVINRAFPRRQRMSFMTLKRCALSACPTIILAAALRTAAKEYNDHPFPSHLSAILAIATACLQSMLRDIQAACTRPMQAAVEFADHNQALKLVNIATGSPLTDVYAPQCSPRGRAWLYGQTALGITACCSVAAHERGQLEFLLTNSW